MMGHPTLTMDPCKLHIRVEIHVIDEILHNEDIDFTELKDVVLKEK